MNREKLISEVKDKYADIAAKANHEINNVDSVSNDKYYEDLLQNVLNGITSGKFDEFNSGAEIVEAVANNKDKWIG